MLRVKYLQEAEQEYAEAALYYEAQSQGLGRKLRQEVNAALEIAIKFPDSGSPYRSKTRRILTKSFRYSIVYRVTLEDLIVVAAAHQSRKPGYWKTR
jgi:toxin ParE1/3/4